MNNIENNTKDFYKELYGECNIKTLESIANKGIFLHEPLFKYNRIKNDEIVTRININAHQFCLINNLKQYDTFINF